MKTVTNSIPIGSAGKLQNNIAMPYQFTIGSLIHESWKRVKGTKATYWGAFFIYLLISLALNGLALFASYLYTAGFPHPDQANLTIPVTLYNIFTTLITLPLPFGIALMAMHRSINLPIKAKEVFSAYRYFWKILGTLIIIYMVCAFILFVTIAAASLTIHLRINGLIPAWTLYPSILLSIIGGVIAVYFLFALSYAPLLTIEKQLGIFQALKTSFLSFKQHGFKIIGAWFCLTFIYLISMIPLGIGLIWTLPMLFNAMGVMYRIQFGVHNIK